MSRSASSSEPVKPLHSLPNLWGILTGIIVAALIAVPLSASVALATHPETRFLLEGKGAEVSALGYTAFWSVAAIFFAALPFITGFGVARLSPKTVKVLAAVVVLFLIVQLVLGQLIF